jgi:DnaK suppressor protein
MSTDLAALAADLRARLAELEALTGAHADDVKPVELDQSAVGRLSRMDAMQVQAMAEAAARMRALEKKRILAALKRIADDEYGFCAKCGEPIAQARLATDVTIAMCIGCAGR